MCPQYRLARYLPCPLGPILAFSCQEDARANVSESEAVTMAPRTMPTLRPQAMAGPTTAVKVERRERCLDNAAERTMVAGSRLATPAADET